MESVPFPSALHHRRNLAFSRWSQKSIKERPAEDLDTDHGYRSSEEKARPSSTTADTTTPRRNYKPVALRLPFLVTHVLLLILAMTAVVSLQATWPDSDHSAIVDGRPLAKLAVVTGRDGVSESAVKRLVVAARSDSTTPELAAAPTDGKVAITAADADSREETRMPSEPPTPTSTERTSAEGGFTTLVPPDIRTSSEEIDPGVVTITLPAPPAEEPTGTERIPSFVPGSPVPRPPPIPPETDEAGDVLGDITGESVTFWTSPVARGPTEHPSPGPGPTVGGEPPVTTATLRKKPGIAPARPIRPEEGVEVPSGTLLVTSIAGSAVTLLVIITTPGKPTTETAVSVVGGTAITVAPPPVTMVVDVGNGVLVTSVSTPPVFVTTMGGTTTTLTRVTTPGRIVTTDIATTVNGTPTTLLAAVLTITPTPSTRMVPYYPDSTAESTRHSDVSGDDGDSSIDGPAKIFPNGSTDGSPGGSTTMRVLPGFTSAEYFAGAFLPTLIAVALALSTTVIDGAAKQYSPFSALSRPGGALGPEAMTLRFGGLGGALATPAALARRGLPVPFVTGALASLSRGLAPLAAEAVGYKLHGTCTHLSVTGCGIALGVAPGPAYALAAMLAVMAALVAVVGVMVTRWETGLYDEPWSIAAMAALTRDPGLRQRLIAAGEPDDAELDALFADGRFGLVRVATPAGGGERDGDKEVGLEEANDDNSDTFYGGEGGSESTAEYGIVPLRDLISGPAAAGSNGWQSSEGILARFGPRHVPFLALTIRARAIFMVLLLGLMALIFYYHLLREDNAFELFMDSQSFGVRLLFAGLGSIITSSWSAFFMSKMRPFPPSCAPFLRLFLPTTCNPQRTAR